MIKDNRAGADGRTPDDSPGEEDAKLAARVAQVRELWRDGRQILIGAHSIAKAARFSGMLRGIGIPHRTLSGALHEAEPAGTGYEGVTLVLKRDFAYDPGMSSANFSRHGIDFIMAQELWDVPHVLVPSRGVTGEERRFIVGKLGELLYAAAFTMQGSRVWLVDCRRAEGSWERIYARRIFK